MKIEQRSLPFVVLGLLLIQGSSLSAETGTVSSPDSSGSLKSRPVITVEATYPGANAQVVADTVAAPIEQQVNGVEKMVFLSSHCTNAGTYTLDITFQPSADLNSTLTLVQNRVSLALPVLPAEVVRQGVTTRKKPVGVLLLVILFSPDGRRDISNLSYFAATQVKDVLTRLPGVGDVVLIGGQDYALRIWLDPQKLAARNLMATDVTRAIEESVKGVAGQPRTGTGQPQPLTVSSPGRLTDVAQFGDIVLKTNAEGGLVRLRDVGRVELGSDSHESRACLDGKPVVVLPVSLFPQTSTGALGDAISSFLDPRRAAATPRTLGAAVQEKMSDLKKSFPPGIDCTLCFDFTPGWEAPDRLAKCDDLMLAPILPPRLSAEESQKKLARCEALLRTTPGVQHVLTLPENPFGRPRSQPRILLNLDPAVQKRGAREQLMRTIRARLEQEIEGVKVRLCGLPLGDFPIDLAISGPEADQVRKLGEKFVQRLAQSKSLTDVGSDPGYSPVPQLFVDVDRAKVKALGLSVKDVFNALQICLGGIDVNVPDFRRGNDTRWVQVQVDDRAGRKTIEEIAQLKIRSNHGEMVPLGTIAQVRQVSGPRVVDRLNLKPMVEITANPAPGVSLAEVRSVCESLADDVLRPSPAYRLTWLQELPLARRPLPEPRSGVTADLLRQVTVSRPVQRQVAHYEDLAGRVQPVESVVLRARVTGFLDKVSFKEGEDVKRGDLLFTIDSREFQSETVRAETVLSRAEGRRHQTAAALDRAKKLQASGALGQEELAKFQADRDDAEGLLREAQASLEVCKLKQSFCQVTAPISGRIGRSLLTPGNLVKADETILANIVSVDPMYVFFSLDERTVLRLRRLALEGKLKSPQKWELRVFLGMADEKGYPRQGTINFVDNRVDPNTGTLQVRAVFPNTDGMLLPGLFVRLRLPIGVPHEALLVPEKAIGSDQGQKFLYVVNQQNRVVFRRVLVVGAQHDGLRVIAEGLQLGERVILSDLDRVSPGVTVSPREVTVRAEPPKREE